VATVQASPGATGRSQKRKEDKFNKDKYTIEVMLDQPCKFHSVSGKLAAHTTHQCSFTRDLEQGNHQLPGPPPGLPAEAQGNKNRQPAKATGTTPRKPMWSNIMCSPPRWKTRRMSLGLVSR
jgi:hypothetical protein